MFPEAAIAILLKQIASAARISIVPNRRDQTEPTDGVLVTYTRISTDGNSGLGGSAHQDKSRIQIDLSGPRKAEVLIAAKAIRNHIDGYRGSLTSETFGELFVCGIEYSSERATYSPAIDGGEAGDYVHAVDYMVDMAEAF